MEPKRISIGNRLLLNPVMVGAFSRSAIPDSLRLTTGLHVAQVDGHTWAVPARGFNIPTANKLQALMDGRSLYTPT